MDVFGQKKRNEKEREEEKRRTRRTKRTPEPTAGARNTSRKGVRRTTAETKGQDRRTTERTTRQPTGVDGNMAGATARQQWWWRRHGRPQKGASGWRPGQGDGGRGSENEDGGDDRGPRRRWRGLRTHRQWSLSGASGSRPARRVGGRSSGNRDGGDDRGPRRWRRKQMLRWQPKHGLSAVHGTQKENMYRNQYQ